MAYEDWTDGGTWTEGDSGGDLTVAANTITIDSMARQAEAYLIGDYGAAHWNGDFDIDVASLFDVSASDNYSSFAVIGMTNNSAVRTIQEMNAANHGWNLYWYHAAAAETTNLCLREWVTNNEDCTGYVSREEYYITMIRTGNTLEAELYTDAARTVLHDTLSIIEGAVTFRYILNATSYETPGNTNHCTGWVKNLDLNEAAADVSAGIKIWDGAADIELVKDDTSPVKIETPGGTIGVKLVATGHADASAIRIYDGAATKAFKKKV